MKLRLSEEEIKAIKETAFEVLATNLYRVRQGGVYTALCKPLSSRYKKPA